MFERVPKTRREHWSSGVPRPLAVGALIKKYRGTMVVDPANASRERAILNLFEDLYGLRPVASITPEHIDAWWARLRAAHAPGTCNRHLVRIRHLFVKAQEWGYVEVTPVRMKKLREPKGRVKYLTDTQRDALISAASTSPSPWLQRYIIAARYAPGRRGNLHALQRQDIDLDAMTVTLRDTKNGDHVVLPLLAPLLAALQPLPDDPAAFLLAQVHPCSVSRAFRKLCVSVGIRGFRFHDMRHDVGTSLAEAGVNQRGIMAALGHRDPRSSMRYTHMRMGSLRATMEKL
jgi:integrase